METLEQILRQHAARYPQMEPRDAVKLIYQNEFGGGHLIRDVLACQEYLQKEYASVRQDPDAPLLEDIGNGLVRVNLAALDTHGISPEELGNAFICSAGIHRGSLDSFRRKLLVLQSLTRLGKTPFCPDSLRSYLADYEDAGFPPVSHSDTYRNAYHPAYRVVIKQCLPKQVL